MKKLLVVTICLLPFMGWTQTFQEDWAGTVSFTSEQVISLAKAFPEDLYDWRPAEGVRSVGEAILHVASGNYFFAMLAGNEIPEGVDPMTMESAITGKGNIIETLKKSYEFVIDWGSKVTDESMGDEINFPDGSTRSKRVLLFIGLSHSFDHKGQLVAYARSNGITPPWSE